jgi:hypothetical protein
MKRTALALSVVFLLAAGCNKASDSDVDNLIDDWTALWDGYLKVITDNKADPDKAVAEGQKYIDANQEKIKKVAKVFGMRGTEKQIDRVKKASESIGEKQKKTSEELGEAWAGKEQYAKWLEQAQKFSNQMMGQ